MGMLHFKHWNGIFGINYLRNLVWLVVLIYSIVFEFQAETDFWQVTKKGIAFCEIAFSFVYISSSWWFNDLFPAGLKKKKNNIKSMHEFRFLASRFSKLVFAEVLRALKALLFFPLWGSCELYHRAWKEVETGLHRTQDGKLPASKKLGFTSRGKLRHQELGFHLAFIFMTLSEHGF